MFFLDLVSGEFAPLAVAEAKGGLPCVRPLDAHPAVGHHWDDLLNPDAAKSLHELVSMVLRQVHLVGWLLCMGMLLLGAGAS